jgi:predicted ferric reductase
MLVLMLPPFRRRFYEVMVRSHQVAGFVTLLGIWLHVSSTYYRWCLKIVFCLLGATSLAQICFILVINRPTRSRTMPQAEIENLEGNMLKITITMPRPVKVRPGQFIHLWLPTISLTSFYNFILLPSHPGMNPQNRNCI